MGSWLVDPCPLGLPHQVTILLFPCQLFKLSLLAPTQLCLVIFKIFLWWCFSQIPNFTSRQSVFAETAKDLFKYMYEGFNAPWRQLLRAHPDDLLKPFFRDWRDLVFYTSLPSLVSLVLVRIKTWTQNMDNRIQSILSEMSNLFSDLVGS